MKIGNIYNYGFDIPDFFNSVKEIDAEQMTLIVGWKNTKQLYPQMSILNWKISDNIYWTVEPNEDKIIFEKNIINFKNACIDKIVSQYNYNYIDLLLNPNPQLDLSSQTVILLRNNIFYIKNFKNIYGISLELSTHLNYSLKNKLFNQKVEIEDGIQEKFGIEDRFLVCFL
jgi:hypothetical protein